MDQQNPDERPSIFSRPDPDAPVPRPPTIRPEPRVPGEPTSWEPTASWDSAASPDRDAPRLPPPSRGSAPPPVSTGLSRRTVLGLGGAGLVVLLVGGFLIGGMIRGDDETLAVASTSPSASATSTPEATPSPTPSPTPSATPVPTPAGPPQEVPVGAWATVTVDELNVRSAASSTAETTNLLVKGAVMHIAEGPVAAEGYNWYRVASLGGAAGWAASGPAAEPFMSTLVNDPTLVRCAKVERPVFDVDGGTLVPHEPVSLGDLSLPVRAFSDLELGALELTRGLGGEACITAVLDASGIPQVQSQIAAWACGRPVVEGGQMLLRPSSGTGSAQSSVKDPTFLNGAVLGRDRADDPIAANVEKIFLLAAGMGEVACMNAQSDDAVSQSSSGASSSLCLVVHKEDAGSIVLSPAGGEWVRLAISDGGRPPEGYAREVARLLSLDTNTGQPWASAWDSGECQ